ncbi:uncharacterized protein LOC131680534 [Topomyia yanbarensis]|uniref:uncharacterized protein LOC131680534 n=1 Tax=Topomyia yanbarensis TaxID=2498891 RepID=UPI00273AE057|nr:uncharacterized protein LOC131680534 [Topomyia yanbarensis]
MQLRSASVKKTLFPGSPLFALRSAKVLHTPVLSVEEQKKQQEIRETEYKMAESINALVQCCAATKGKVERIRRAIYAAGNDSGKFNIHGLNLYLKTVDSAYMEYNDFQNRIYLSHPSKRAEFETGFVEFEELYEYVRIELSKMIQNHEDEQKAIGMAAAMQREQQMLKFSLTEEGNRPSTSGYQPGSVQARIPSLLLQNTPLPTFDGRYENWFKFKAMFCDIIDRCTSDSPATKLHFLDKALVAKAQGAIDQQTLNDNNYEGAWKILTERFENLPMVIHGHITKLLNLKPMAKESFQELKTLVDDCEKRVDSLEFHKLNMDKMAEAIIVTLLTSKLDPDTRKCWETTIEHGKLPVYKDTIAFLRKRSYVLERCEQAASLKQTRGGAATTETAPFFNKVHSVVVQKNENHCPVCESNHHVEMCEDFKKLSIAARYNKAKQAALCFSCLRKGHRTANCRSSQACSTCSKKHHSLMHPEERKLESSNLPPTELKSGGAELTAAKCTLPDIVYVNTSVKRQVLLATAVVHVLDSCGMLHNCRALLDSGAMANFVSERMIDLLGLRKECVEIPVIGVNGMKTLVKFKAHAIVKSRTMEYEFGLDYLIIPKVTGALPTRKIDIVNWPIPNGVVLADRNFNEPSRIDMLIGAEVFYGLLLAGKIRMSDDLPLLQESVLGWLIAGAVADVTPVQTARVCQVTPSVDPEDDLSELVRRFWAIDEQVEETFFSDDGCEEHFKQTHIRTKDGRYVVMLPFRTNVTDLGESRKQAERRFELLERRLDNCPDLKRMYGEFIDEYVALGHCVRIERNEDFAYYLPHHCVLKPDSSSTKLRVVFDASAKSDTGLSLNDVMKVGPTVQSSLFDIILRFRTFKYSFTADVPKMYRQILVNEAHTCYQRILWRKVRSDPLSEFELKTVTYGTAAAPYLATRSLLQLANDEEREYPSASVELKKSFYIDDVLSGANTLVEAKKLRDDLVKLLAKGGFELHKWCANDDELLEGIPLEAREKQMAFENCNVNGVIKTLGLYWNPTSDEFMFRVRAIDDDLKLPTKRQVLSETAKLFDPLGLLAPTIVIPKLIMQQLWVEKIDWDETIPSTLFERWNRFRSELCDISNAKIERRVTVDDTVKIELHGFADASTIAYGCCIYLRSVKVDDTAEMKLICGRSRVAPLKETQRGEKPDAKPCEMTVPRLELCAALLLARQMKAVREALAVDASQVMMWSDSMIVLSWLQKTKQDTSVFVRNHVAKIQMFTSTSTWHHIPTKQNPADVVSRGLFPTELMDSMLWWKGPPFLQTTEYDEKFVTAYLSTEAQVIACSTAAIAIPENRAYDVILATSNFRRLQRVFGYIAKFIFNCRRRRMERRTCERLDSYDLREALRIMVICVQRVVYVEEIHCIQKNKSVKGKLRNLNPMLDNNILRVGGRIRHSDLPKDQKHPMILPEKNHFTELLVDALHREHLHVGLNGLLAIIRQKYWPVNAKRTIHRVLKRCVTCFRAKPKTLEQYMGDLPSCRVTAAAPFIRTGVDYAGPFYLKQGRGKAAMKAYVSLFVCMSTKAIHLELVTSLTTDGFLAALHRFVGRRGNVLEMFSDNGTNFTGACKDLIELRQLLNSQALQGRIDEFCQLRGILWRFNPPKAPHQGGLWESNVKSMKNHLYKSLSESYMTYEEMNTLLIQIEAILNSRPLIPMNDDLFDYEALSPGHFLIGRELTAVAEPFYDGLKDGVVSRYQLVQKRKQCFWRRWSNEYVTTLQKRSKWTKEPALLRPGLLVILKEDNVPPQMWKLGRISETHPGKDGVTRVVTIRTSRGTYRRPTT